MPEKDLPKKSRRSTGAMTLRDVAKLAGVAPITASRAINTPDQVSAEVLRKVQEALVRTGYVPNRMAGGLASSRSRLIAAVTPSTVMSVFMGTIEALNGTLLTRITAMLGRPVIRRTGRGPLEASSAAPDGFS
jgi:LacI family gluconate utilization system Gnt-I transcriptional repressor